MKSFKKLSLLILFSFFLFFSFILKTSFAESKEVNLYFFWGKGCPHCANEKPFLESLKEKYPQLKVYDFEVWYNKENRDLLIAVGKHLKIDISGIPLTIINNQPIVGYYNDKTTGKQIEDLIIKCLKESCNDSVKELVLKTPTTLINQNEIKGYLFWTEGCPLCNQEKAFLKTLEKEYPNLKIIYLNINQEKNIELFKEVVEELDITNAGLPLLIIGEKTIIGWRSEETTGKAIKEVISCYLETKCPDLVGKILTHFTALGESTKEKPLPDKIRIPLVGEIETKKLSLPFLAIILGGLDGFNPCAMWVLVFLITFLIKMQDRKKIWILGTTFIVSSALVYFLFMSAWLNLILFLGFIFWIRLLVGLIALGSGIYNLRDYFTNPEGTCKVTPPRQKKNIIEKIKEIVHQKEFILAFIGIIILAAMVNLIELICSVGFPVIFTQVLALSQLAKWQYYLYMLLYIFVFMLDDLIVFIGAMLTLKITGITNKYSRLSHLIGGILMLLIGLFLIFKPELLMFS